jgi:hypothetical protein
VSETENERQGERLSEQYLAWCDEPLSRWIKEASEERLSSPPEQLLRSCRTSIDALARQLAEAKRVIEETERDARWIVGQWPRLQEPTVNQVAKEMVERCVAALNPPDPPDPPASPAEDDGARSEWEGATSPAEGSEAVTEVEGERG